MALTVSPAMLTLFNEKNRWKKINFIQNLVLRVYRITALFNWQFTTFNCFLVASTSYKMLSPFRDYELYGIPANPTYERHATHYRPVKP